MTNENSAIPSADNILLSKRQITVAWGNNFSGQLGDDTYTCRNFPVAVKDLPGVKAIAAGYTHSLALWFGSIIAWGSNSNGQLGHGLINPHSPSLQPKAATNSNVPVKVDDRNKAVVIASGGTHILALTVNGDAWAWGNNSDGQLGNGSHTYSSVPVLIPERSGIPTAIAAGHDYSLAVLADGTVRAWGNNSNGQLGNGDYTGRDIPVTVKDLTGVTAIAASRNHCLALLCDGTVRAWGNNSNGQLGNNANTGSNTPVTVKDLTGVKAIATGYTHSLVLLSDGTVRAWGDNTHGQLGNGTYTGSNVPIQITGLTNVTAIAAGSFHSLARLSNGTVFAWGSNDYGQLGNGTYTGSNVPIQVKELTGVTAIACGSFHSLAIMGGA